MRKKKIILTELYKSTNKPQLYQVIQLENSIEYSTQAKLDKATVKKLISQNWTVIIRSPH